MYMLQTKKITPIIIHIPCMYNIYIYNYIYNMIYTYTYDIYLFIYLYDIPNGTIIKQSIYIYVMYI